MGQLVYTEAELLASHDFAEPQVEAGRRLHGGFDAHGRYISPRVLHRERAVESWLEALRARGGDLMPADASLLDGTRYPNVAQMKLLLEEGLGQTFWNILTITGRIEGRGRVLADLEFPDFQEVIVEDISEMGTGHLSRGLLKAHGLDEGGEPDEGVGGHDVMWFALRDLAFGEVDYAEPPEPQLIRPDSEAPMPPIADAHGRTLSFLLNLLLIEFRAELGFASSQALLRDPDLFRDRRDEADHAAEIVERIRTDEEIHVSSLRLYLGEMRQCTFRTTDGGEAPGCEVLDPLWAELVHWATVEQPKQVATQQRQLYRDRILAHPEGERILRDFDTLEDAG